MNELSVSLLRSLDRSRWKLKHNAFLWVALETQHNAFLWVALETQHNAFLWVALWDQVICIL
ncbi:hypothetical protein MAL08_19530 (plasmid) [Leptospira noguchii]|uniref:hypothetical protein n=1 Tax=Leptospira noguchii TaxID=28182 RepID=UPI001FB6A12D|nr:hypothetical protein [Leptospira noguchii]UOG40004.1 hypothetical protein MAL08_19530 [Leptospira noguchii]